MGNTVSNYTIIRVTPTLSTDAYAQGDVLFTATEIPDAVRGNGGCSMLMGMFLLDQSDIADSDIDFFFSEGSTAFGTINETAGISDADLEAIGINGFCKCDASVAQTSSHIDTARMHHIIGGAAAASSVAPLMLLQAASASTSVYVQGLLTSATTPTYAADDIDLIFHIKYL